MSRDVTTIELKRSTWKALNQRKEPGDSFDDIVRELLVDEAAESPETAPDDPPARTGRFACPTCGDGYASYEAMQQHMAVADH